MLYLFQQILNGLHMSALYALLAFGYALTNGVVRRTNLAYGALFAFSGQTMILVAVFGWYALWLTLPATVALGILAGFAYAALVSAVLARNVFAPLAIRTPNAVVVATLGVALMLMEIGRIAAETRDFWLPPLLARPVVFASQGGFRATLTVMQLVNCGVILAVLVSATIALAQSRFGRRWRAVCDDPKAAAMCGVDVPAVFRRAILAGGLAAALAGILTGLHFGNVSFGTGLVFGLKILFVTAVGGYDSPPRAAAGAAVFGMAESLWSGYFPIEWRDAAVFLGLVALLVLRPGNEETRTARP
ncbi:MAG TPA: branched-chain amino acid ABC transporter permease [Rhizobiaceae bacterium]|nr:branched-chain amino acid ABC transporter permease [Rhizobiaceae bacterium]